MNTPNQIRVVHEYADCDWPVFPLHPNSKIPAIAGSFKAASTDHRQIDQWYAENRNYNWAAATGGGSIVVVDSDGEIGSASMAALAILGCPETFTVKTRTGIGRHFYFQPPLDFEVPCSASALAPSVDIRGEGGYVVIPPSFVPGDHKGLGGKYEVLLDSPVVPLPEWLESKLRQLSRPRPTKVALSTRSVRPETPRNIALLREQLRFVSADCGYERYRCIVWAILSSGWESAEDIARWWSQTAPHRFDEQIFGNLIRYLDSNRADCPSFGSIVYAARAGGWHG